MLHTLEMRSWRQRTAILLMGLAIGVSICSAQTAGAAQDGAGADPRWKRAIDETLHAAPDARVVVLEIDSGRLLASAHFAAASDTLATPGSTLKPLILYYALESRRWSPERRIICRRRMHLGSHELNCSHPAAGPMNAQQALTWSCNSYFAELAASLSPQELRQALSERGLLAATGLTREEELAAFREPRKQEQIQLAALGIEGVRVTLPELAEAYRSLATALAAHRETVAASTVAAGLADSASFGMAGAASLGGVPVAGKTGTASAESGGPTHGWFVGLAPAESPRVVVAVYIPAGHGSDAAQVAAKLLAFSPLRKQ